MHMNQLPIFLSLQVYRAIALLLKIREMYCKSWFAKEHRANTTGILPGAEGV